MALRFNLPQIVLGRAEGVLRPLELRLVDFVEMVALANPIIKIIHGLSRFVPGFLHDGHGIRLALLQLRILDLHLLDKRLQYVVVIEDAADRVEHGLLKIVGVYASVRANDLSLARGSIATIIPGADALRVRRRPA